MSASEQVKQALADFQAAAEGAKAQRFALIEGGLSGSVDSEGKSHVDWHLHIEALEGPDAEGTPIT